jgi:hypothetical protein
MLQRSSKLILAVLLTSTFLIAQDFSPSRAPSVSMSPAPLISIHAGKPGQVDLRFHVAPGFHINSNKPKSEFLIATALKLDAPTDIVIGRVTYPKGEELSFPFAPEEKLSVYSGTFDVGIVVRPLHDVIPTKYMVRGNLRYQACDKAACYPPKNLPVQFEVKVAIPVATTHRSNPAQSPHIHR